MSVRAFSPAGLRPEPGEVFSLDAEESRYLSKVRRLRVGERFELLDGEGGRWPATIVELGRRVRVEPGPPLPPAGPLPDRVVLLGLPDPPAALEALTGASEMGATEIVVLRCARSQGRVPSPARVERVLRAAMRQCGRPSPPTLRGLGSASPMSLDQALAHRPELPGLFAWASLRDGADERALDDLVDAPGLRLLVGPEGGLTPDEVEELRAAGFSALGLGPWVLRTPTAVVAGLARLHTRRGEHPTR